MGDIKHSRGIKNMGMTEISGDKLKTEIKKRGLSLTEISLELGYSSNYLTESCRRGIAKLNCIKMLEVLYNIKYDSIKPDKKEVDENVNTTDILPMHEPEVNTESIEILLSEILATEKQILAIMEAQLYNDSSNSNSNRH